MNHYKSARACEQCYETVFPVMDGTPSIPGSSIRAGDGTVNSLPEFPEWRSVRISNTGEDIFASSASSALLAADLSPQRESSHTDRETSFDSPALSRNASPRIRIKQPPRPRSYLQILEDFDKGGPPGSGFPAGQASNLENSSVGVHNNTSRLSAGGAGGFPSTSVLTLGEVSSGEGHTEDVFESPTSPEYSLPQRVRWSVSVSPKRREDTIRKKKRFSMPALAIQTTTVTTKTNTNGNGRPKRFSLSLGGRGSSSQPNLMESGGMGTNAEEVRSGGGSKVRTGAAGKLSELLARSPSKNK